MALPPMTVEFRATGHIQNGGGFKIGGAGTDYSQQDNPILIAADLACTRGSTTITSPSGRFQPDFVDNIIYIVGWGPWVSGWYHITAVNSAYSITVDRTPCPNYDGDEGEGRIGGALYPSSTAWFELQKSGSIFWWKSGTYPLSTQVFSNTAMAAAGEIYGYATTRGDTPKGTNRPLITFTTGQLGTLQGRWIVAHLRITGQGATVVATHWTGLSAASVYYNLEITNTRTQVDGQGISVGSGGIAIVSCNISSTNGIAHNNNGDNRLVACYIHDSRIGTNMAATVTNFITRCVYDTFSTQAITMGGIGNCSYTTFYNCPTGIRVLTARQCAITSCIFHTCDTGVYCETEGLTGNQVLACNFYNCTTHTINAYPTWTTTHNPQLRDPLNGDFRPQTPESFTTGIEIPAPEVGASWHGAILPIPTSGTGGKAYFREANL